MKLRLIVSQPSDDVIAEAEAAVHARLISDWLAADRAGDAVTTAHIEYEAELYDPALLDEIRGLSLPAAA